MTHRKFSVGIIALSAMLLAAAPADKKTTAAKAAAAQPAGPVDINNGSEKDLVALPGVGPATAKKIIAGRPYSSVADLSKAGLKPAVIQQITPMVTVGAAPAKVNTPAAVNTPPPAPTKTAAPVTPAPTPAKTSTVAKAAAPGGGAGMVWVNKETKIYHRQGDRWYGKTKSGEYMTEADAIKAGYRDSKQGAAKK